jgi:dihydrolipoamide dehydrogenase
MECKEFDNIIIGAGPAGMRACTVSRQRGESVCVIERAEVGGTCLNRGCIPTKALVQSANVADIVASAAKFGVEVGGDVRADYAVASHRKDDVVAALRTGAEASLGTDLLLCGDACFVAEGVMVGDTLLMAKKKILIATGSMPARLNVPGAELAITSDEFLKLDTLPAEMVVVGGGVIGMECACIARAFGCKVTVVEYCREILPGLDADMAKRLRSMLSRRGITVAVGAAVTSLTAEDSGNVVVHYTDKRGEQSVVAHTVLMATGRRAVLPSGLDTVGVEVNAKGIVVNDAMQTSVPGIYAVGDCNGRIMLAHAASAQADVAMGMRDAMSVVPSVVFTSPECAQVGVLSGDNIVVGKAVYGSNGMATAMGQTDGFVKVAVDAATNKVVGCCAIGAGADAIVQEAAIAISASLSAADLRSKTIFTHPTLSELLPSALPM